MSDWDFSKLGEMVAVEFVAVCAGTIGRFGRFLAEDRFGREVISVQWPTYAAVGPRPEPVVKGRL